MSRLRVPTGEGRRPLFTISRKIAAGYLLITLFSVVAIAYALSSLHAQTARSRHLVSVEFQSLNILRDMRQQLLAQETLEKQSLILKDPSLLELWQRRQRELDRSWATLGILDAPGRAAALRPDMQRYREVRERCQRLMSTGQWPDAERCSGDELVPLRSSLLQHLVEWVHQQEASIDRSIADFSEASDRAYRVTWFLVLLGLGLSAPVAVTVLISIHRSVRALVKATQEIAAGRLGYTVNFERRDEFGLLAREFAEMGRKLRELEQLCLDANPLTRLPGNLAIDREIQARIERGESFAHVYIDLDNFKVYGDRYGYQAGSDVIAWVGEIVRASVRELGSETDLVGHIGGDDYVVLTASERAELLARHIIERFDAGVAAFYNEEDRAAGSFRGKDRYGVERQFPLLSVSVAIVSSDRLQTVSLQAISEACVLLKAQLKALPGSNVLSTSQV